VLTETTEAADYFEAVIRAGADPRMTASWMQRLSHLAETTANLMQRVQADTSPNLMQHIQETAGPIAPQKLAEMIDMVAKGEITAASARDVLSKMFETGKTARQIAEQEGLVQISDASFIEQACREVIAKNPENVAKYKAGNEGVFKFFVGQVMKATRGQANPQLVNDTLKRLLA